MTSKNTKTPTFSSAYAPNDLTLIQTFLTRNAYDAALSQRIKNRAEKFITNLRTASKGVPGLEDFIHEYDLSTKEGLALMVLAEALLRVPDTTTQNRLIEEKLGAGTWEDDGDEGWFLMAASWGINLSAKVVEQSDTPGSVLNSMVKRLGVPVVRTGTRRAMKFLGHHFVLGQTIEEALKRANKRVKKGFRFSYDMLGEGARTQKDAERYFDAYKKALHAIGKHSVKRAPALPNRPGLSVKLSALHPKYVAENKSEVMRTLVPLLLELAKDAKEANLNLTVDAEEADRLELSLAVFATVAKDESLAGWDGFGIAIQAYQKRSPDVVDWVIQLAEHLDRRFMIRLVKGAYWDTEIKRAHERGLNGFPVFTKKAATDLCYLDCAQKLLNARPRIFPQFATHNALTLATILELAQNTNEDLDKESFEFQRLHGMGETLYDLEMDVEGISARIYAPVGGHKDLLAYLVRRLLENSANSSFVAQIADENIPVENLLISPQEELQAIIDEGNKPISGHIPLPANLFKGRDNSSGLEMGYTPHLSMMQAVGAIFKAPSIPLMSIIDGSTMPSTGKEYEIGHPADARFKSGNWVAADEAVVKSAAAAAQAAFPAWNAHPVEQRAKCLYRLADLLEKNRDTFLSILSVEAGKTISDGISEIREAVDFCRYYADEARKLCVGATPLPGPAGESNTHQVAGRGVFACISPWNFPLAITLGQIAAALVMGNTVVAKPAEQTPMVAAHLFTLIKEAGFPDGVANMILGGGNIGRTLIEHSNIGGVVFTGSTATARHINQALAQKDGPIVPLIAETGGVNAMIVDSTALAEQVADDVVTAAFQSAGQRCSALRMLYLQEDIADHMLKMIIGATDAMRIGDPVDPATDIGPVIDEAAKGHLLSHISKMRKSANLVYEGRIPDTAPSGTYIAPHIFEMPTIQSITTEAFGPILHVARWNANELDNVIDAINRTGYGLTFGLHSRLETLAEYVAPRIDAGNIYINRNMIGAVVGSQPFGGNGLSGTGPKAGGPLYLHRFASEKTISVNTAAAGGNASLIALSD